MAVNDAPMAGTALGERAAPPQPRSGRGLDQGSDEWIPLGVALYRAVAGPGLGRRGLDIVLGGAALLLTSLPILLLMLAVRLDSPGPALFRQVRVGQGGRPFTMYKLRSMRIGAGGPEVTAAADPRVTRLGRLLRATSLDELPQLWNVLRGQMTLVGPRPETPALAAGYPRDCRWVLAHRPGLTGPAQVRIRDAHVVGSPELVDTRAYLDLVVPARAAIEARFLADPSLPATIRVILETVRHLLGRPRTAASAGAGRWAGRSRG